MIASNTENFLGITEHKDLRYCELVSTGCEINFISIVCWLAFSSLMKSVHVNLDSI